MGVNGVELAYEEAGSGQPLLLIHAGIADRSMWDDTQGAFADRYRVIRPDLRGYGETPLPDGPFVYAADMAELLRGLDAPRAHVIGVSMGGSVAMDLALAHPELVDRLVLVAPGLSGWEWGEEAQAGFAAEEAAVKAGDLDEASWVAVRMWLDGLSRTPDEVDPELRRRVFEMQRHALEYDNDKAEGGWLVADRRGRMGEITSPTLMLCGNLDQPDMVDIARHMAGQIPGARLEVMEGVAHLPPMEAPEAFIGLVVPFLEGGTGS